MSAVSTRLRSIKYIGSRVRNAWRCYVSYALSLFGSVRIVHRPMFVSVEPAAICQLHCPECPVGMRKGERLADRVERFMSREVWERVLEQIAPYAHTVQFYFQGEPLLNRDLPQMIREAHERGLYTIVSTNAQALTMEVAEELVKVGLSKIIVSMDGLTEETYAAYRVGGSLEQCTHALSCLRAAKERLRGGTIIELQCLRLRSNEHEWKEFQKRYKAFGADRLVFKTAQLYDYSDGHPLMPSDERYSRYTKGVDGHYHRKPIGRGCLRVWSGVVITTTGEVLPCCYDKAHAHAYGNIMKESLETLFGNERALAFRKAALQQSPDICKQCWK